MDFRYGDENSMSISDLEPEKAIAYQEEFVREIYVASGPRIMEPIRYGVWSEGETKDSYQDIVVAEKRSGPEVDVAADLTSDDTNPN